MPHSENKNDAKTKELPRFLLIPIKIIGFVLFLFIFFTICLSFNSFQNWTKDRILHYINSSYHQDIQIQNLNFNLFTGFTSEILIRDHHQDTLIYTSKIQVGLLKSLATLYSGSLSLNEIMMDSSVVKIIKYKGEVETNLNVFIAKFKSEAKNTSNPLQFNLKRIELSNSRLYFEKENIHTGIQFDHLNASIDSVNNILKYYKLRKILIENPVIEFNKSINDTLNTSSDSIHVIPSDTCQEGFGISVDFININNGNVNLAIENKDSIQHFSFNTIFFSCFQAYVSNDLTQFDFIQLNAKTKDEFALKNATINRFRLNEHNFNIDKFKLETGRSNLELKFQLAFENDVTKPKTFENAFLKLDISHSLIDPKDISYFLPQWNLYNFIRLKTSYPFYLHGKIFGTLNNLKGNDILFKYEDQFSFQGNVHTRNLLNKDKELINLKINKLATNASFIRTLFPEYNIPEGYNKFGKIALKGNFDGYFHDFVAYGSFQTDLGLLQSDIKVKLDKKDKTALYSGSFNVVQLEIGKLLNNSDLGNISMTSQILNGKGLSKESMYANLEAAISDLEYKNYHYKDIRFKGNVNKDLLVGEIQISDEHAQLYVSGKINRLNEKYKVQLAATVSKLNFKALHFTNDSMNYSGTINCDFIGSEENNLNGYFEALNSKLFINDSAVLLKNIRLEQWSTNTERKIKLNSDLINSEVEGNFKIRSIKDNVIAFLIKKYPGLSNIFNLQFTAPVNTTTAKGYLYIKDGHKLSQLFNIPILIDKADCDFSFDNTKNIFEISSNRFDLAYKDFSLSKLSFDIVSSENLKLLFTSDYLSKEDTKLAGNFKLLTNYNGQTGQSSIQVFDSTNSKILLNTSYAYSYLRDTFKISFNNKDLFINNNRWKINPKNSIVKTKNSLEIANLEITDSLHFFSLRDYNKKGIILKSDGFDISFVNQFIRNKSIAFFGLFSTEIRIPDLTSFSNSIINISIFQMHYNKDNFGPFKLDVAIDDYMEPWKVKVENIFQEHIIRGTGSINIPIKSKNYAHKPFDFDVDLDLQSFPMSFLENFITSISKTTGSANGKLRFYSNNKELNLIGDMNIVNGNTVINYLGIPIQFKNQPVRFFENLIVFDKLTLEDKLGNPVLLNGRLTHTNLKEFAVDIRVTSDKALLLDTKKNDNLFYYGYGIGRVDAKFLGPIGKLNMDVNVSSLKGTKINIPIQNSQSANESKFVKFISHQSKDTLIQNTYHTTIDGLDLNMQLSMTEDAEIAIIFDELAGDILKGHGRGNLTLKSLRNGLFTVNGNYEVEEGQYLFTLYNFVNKPFTIKRGGNITWTGDPLDAYINLEAVYEGLYASPYPLVQEFYADPKDIADLKQLRTEAKVRMLLTGSLIKPTIKFDIDLPELTGKLKNDADRKLRYLRGNEDQLNQQVFGLLVLRTFISTDIKSEVIGNLGTTTINTLSEMLSNQFSLFVSNLLSNAFDDVNFISGVDFNIGYDLSNKTIGTSNLNEGEVVFSLKHRLWNDKWIVTLGGNYKSNPNISLYGNSNFNPESVIEWNTPVTGLKLRIYYKADESIEGLKHKIGTGVNYRKEFDSFLDFEGELKKQSQKFKQEQYEQKKL